RPSAAPGPEEGGPEGCEVSADAVLAPLREALAARRPTVQFLAELQQQHWDTADEIHRSLMVDHVNEVSQWLGGVKRLIAETRNLPTEEPAAATDGSTEAEPDQEEP
ncbi:PREDICTED: steroid receptor RNA activator 1, partial [Mesitornis unicolor]|uniref:steroid receptor RNA activator 1 n=1 Tax=Mesitornis unicolor TaxID=54374 RepID=UPI000528ED6C